MSWNSRRNKPGTAQVGAISKAQKYQKDFKMSKYWWIGTTFMNKKIMKKSLTISKKNWKGGPFGIFQQPFCCKTPKNWRGAFRGEKVFFLKKVKWCRKNGPFGLVRYCMLRGKPFWFSSLGQQVHFGVFWKFCRTFGRTILVSSGLKTLTKSHDNSRLFSKEKRRLKSDCLMFR